MGAVFVARDAQGARVALKVVLSGDARFEVEGRTAGRLEHPNVVSVRAAGRDGARSWLAMELVDGEPLDARLRRGGPLEPRDAARWVAQAARGVEHAHAQGVLHRDLKPANIIVDAQGVARVLDFGVARDARSAERLTQTGELVGTPAFMAPEQAGGERALDARVDVWGLGATLYCLLVGRPPFQGATALNIVTSILTTASRPPRAERPELDPALEAIVLRCLAKAPNGRFASPGELAAELEAWSARAERPARAPLGWLLVGAGLVLLALPLAVGLLRGSTKTAPTPPTTTTSAPTPTTPTTPPPPAPPVPPPPPPTTTTALPVPPPTTTTAPEPEPKPEDPPSVALSSGPVEPAPSTEALLHEPPGPPDVDLDLTEAGRAGAPGGLELQEGWWATPLAEGIRLRTTLGNTSPRLRLPIAAPTGPLEVWIDAEVTILDEDTDVAAVVLTGAPEDEAGAGLRLACEVFNQNHRSLREQASLVTFARRAGKRSGAPKTHRRLATTPEGPTVLSDAHAVRLRLAPAGPGTCELRGFVAYELFPDSLPFAPRAGPWAVEVGVRLPGVADQTPAQYEPAQVVEVVVYRLRVWGAAPAPLDEGPQAALGRAAWAQLARGDTAPLASLVASKPEPAIREGASLLLALAAADDDRPGQPPTDGSAQAELDRLARRGGSPRQPPHPAELATSVSPLRRALLARALGNGTRYSDAVADGTTELGFGPPAERPDPDWGLKALNLALAAVRAPDASRTPAQRFGEGCVWYMAGDYEQAQAIFEALDGHPIAPGWGGLAAYRRRRFADAGRLWDRLPTPRAVFSQYIRGLRR